MIGRKINPVKSNSYFLFWPRGTGKTTWLRSKYSDQDALFLDLLDLQSCDDLMMDIGRFDQIIDDPKNKIVIIDEGSETSKNFR